MYAVIFTSQKSSSTEGYAEMNAAAYAEAQKMEGFIAEEGLRNEAGFGISASYWENEEAIERWRNNALHRVAKQQGRSGWFDSYSIRICKVEHEIKFTQPKQ